MKILEKEARKLAYLNELIHQDAIDPIVVELASRLVRPIAPDNWLEMSRTIFRWVRDGIRMQRDPDLHEEFASSMEILQKGYDDCDGKVRLAAAMLNSLGIQAWAHPVWAPEGWLKHVQLGVKFPGSYRARGARPDGTLIGDLTIAGAELGDDIRRIAPNPETDRFPFAGGPKRV